MDYLLKALAQFGNTYDRQARLYPALLTLAPAIVLVVTLYQDKFGLYSSAYTVLLACGALFMMAEFARQRGKAKEEALWQKWGGAPSTQVLRHRDSTFDMVSKTRYHAACSKLLNQPFLSQQQEKDAPDLADALYTSACTALREAARDKEKYELLFKDLTSYGFRRNGYGLRTVGIVISLGSLAWVVIRHGLPSWMARLQAAPNIEALFSGGELVTVGTALVMLLMWVFFFTEQNVRAAAFTYARSLILTCEQLVKQTPNASTTEPVLRSV